METAIAAVCSFIIDLLLGDPPQIPHPVVIMGKCISFFEKLLRKLLPETPAGETAAGAILAFIMAAGTLVFTGAVLFIAGLIHPVLRFVIEIIWGWQCLAMRDLKKESMNVYDKLRTGTIDEARTAVSRIVGRDTQNLSEEGVTKAAVETVAENFSDGEIAPMLYLLIGGAPLAMCYKAINTMDSMVGYKNDKYINFGHVPARLDDVANFIPSRLAAVIMIFASVLCRADGKNAARIWKRDRRNHASPNSAQTESVMAGALRVQLAGPAYYFGEYYDKKYIGDPIRPIEKEDIKRANRIMYCGGITAIILMAAVRVIICAVL